MASICNDDWASLGVMSGHERKTLRLSPIASPASPERAHPRHSQDVCRNTWRRLHETRFAPHFDFIGDFSRHFGLFEGCGSALDPMASGVVEALIYSLRDR